MPRSVKLRVEVIAKVQTIVHNNFYCQNDLADELGFAQSTISNFINGRAVDRRKFQDICEKLGIEDWRELAEVPPQKLSTTAPPLKQFPIPAPPKTTRTVVTTSFALETPEGSVPLNSPFYIERLPQETYCRAEIAKPHALIRLKAPRQMGKTSMMMRLLDCAEIQGDRVVYLSLEQAPAQALSDADKLLQWFCASIAIKAKHKFQQEDYSSLTSMVGSTLATQEYFESHLLPDLATPLTIGLDSIDRIFDYPHLCNDFFSLLRSLHEAGKHTEILSKLRLVVSHAAEVYVPLDINRSPFNVGISIEIDEFRADQIELLATKHQLNWTNPEIDRLMELIGGHPFLVRLVMFEAASKSIDLTQAIATASSRGGIFDRYHLSRIESTLKSQPDLLAAINEVFRSPTGVSLSSNLKHRLEGLGVVKITDELVVPRCELYSQHFSSLADWQTKL
jgi:transcriptional regulator with XRE-family HTH domain